MVRARAARTADTCSREPPEEISVREVIAASELETFDLHCVSHPVGEERCSASQSCSIRPVWMLLQRKIDDVLESVHLSDLCSTRARCAARRAAASSTVAERPVAADLVAD